MPTLFLFTPGRIGTLTVRNRIIKAATLENMAAADGRPTDALLHFYTTLARGGAGLLITGFSYVNPAGRAYPRQNGAHSDEIIPGWRRITAQVHAHGAAIAMQISHGGRQICQPGANGAVPVAPSAVRNLVTLVRPRAMTEEEIWETVQDFAAAASRVQAAGFDAVQIQAAHGYLLSAFLSPLTNRRRDGWGGSPDGRFRFLREVYLAVRRTVGPDFPVLVKLNVDDFLPGGVRLQEAKLAARRLAALGVDALEISGGVAETIFFAARGEIPIDEVIRGRPLGHQALLRLLAAPQHRRVRFAEAYFLPYIRRLRPLLPTPLILVGGMREPERMEAILAAGEADFIALGRPLIRQPFLPHLWEAGFRMISRCEACNRCVAAVHRGFSLRCYRTAKIGSDAPDRVPATL
jgi:2,4-dienoyl-CoA reductase-like NADH-dependent reductase (Old Yellow Enzyme family)